MAKVLVIGGANIDYFGKASNKLKLHDSNVGNVKISFGGVARNICENLARLGIEVTFISAIGHDDLGLALKRELTSLNVKVITPNTDLPSSSYLAIHDSDGDMLVALCDGTIMEIITPTYLQAQDALIKEHEYLILDGNLTQETINYLIIKYPEKKFIVDGTSSTKVLKFNDVLRHLYLLKINVYEAQALVKANLTKEDLINALKQRGLTKVIVTQGKNDIYYLDDGKVKVSQIEAIEEIENATGAGDAMLAGITYGLIKGKSLDEALNYGKKLSSLTIKTSNAVNKNLNMKMIEK